jgi:hypothetical protein
MMADVPLRDETERVLRLIFSFLDLSRDVERNREDAKFRNGGGTINYIFDANVFEVFIDPEDDRGHAASLHTPRWANEHARSSSGAWSSIASQTALLTSEYLLGGSLPGQKNSNIYMTQWHRWELTRRVPVIAAEYDTTWKEASEAKRVAWLRRFYETFDPDAETKRDIQSDAREDPYLANDVERFRQSGHDDADAIRDFISMRRAVRAMASDEVVEPREQLSRIVTPPLRNRLSTLHLTFTPNDDERDQIAADSREWQRLLAEECEQRRILIVDSKTGLEESKETRRIRSRAALRDDARSLALIRWVAVRKQAPDTRFAFVTADALLFDTYRRWYANLLPGNPEYSEPFILRRIGQFAPIFNLRDAGTITETDDTNFFTKLERTLEVIMLPFNLSRLNIKGRSDQALTRMRELDALRSIDPAGIAEDEVYKNFVSVLNPRHIKMLGQSIDHTLDEWRHLERVAIGVAEATTRERVSGRRKTHEAMFVGQPPSGQQAIFERYVASLIENILEGSYKLSFPLAKEFVREWRPKDRSRLRRAPIALRLELRSNDRRTTLLGSALEEWRQGNTEKPLVPDRAWPALLGQPPLVFAMAACLALASEDWVDADQFADTALRTIDTTWSGPEFGPITRLDATQIHELGYLSALARRFRLGLLSPPLHQEGLLQVRQMYSNARELLTRSERFHAAHRPLRRMRSLSERAALHLFFAAALMPAVRHQAVRRFDRPEASELDRVRAWRVARFGAFDRSINLSAELDGALGDAEADLAECLQMEAEISGELSADRREFFAKLQKQFLPNIAAYTVLRVMREPPNQKNAKRKLDFPPSSVVERVRKFYDDLSGEIRPLLKMELLAFFGIYGDREAIAALRQLTQQRSNSILLDAALFSAIKELFPE